MYWTRTNNVDNVISNVLAKLLATNMNDMHMPLY
jgi:hypothetical protein